MRKNGKQEKKREKKPKKKTEKKGESGNHGSKNYLLQLCWY